MERAKASMMVATVYVSIKQNTRLGSEFSKMFPYWSRQIIGFGKFISHRRSRQIYKERTNILVTIEIMWNNKSELLAFFSVSCNLEFIQQRSYVCDLIS